MGTWTYNPLTMRAVLSGDGAETAFVAPRGSPPNAAVLAELTSPAHEVGLLLKTAFDGRRHIAVRVVGSNLVIRTRTLAGVVTTEASTPHGLTAGAPFKLEGRIVDGKVEARLNGAAAAALSWTVPDEKKDFLKLRHWGFIAAVDGATVQKCEQFTLAPDYSSRADAFVAVCAGDVFACTDNRTVGLVKAGVFNPNVPVSLCEHNGKVYGCDGTRLVVIDVGAGTAEPLAPSDGILPGAVETSIGSGTYVPGSCSATQVFGFLGRLGLVVGPHLHFSASGDPLDWDNGAEQRFRAFATPVDAPGIIQQPITCAQQVSRGVLLVGCRGSAYRFIGDPGFGPPQIDPILMPSGISGPESMAIIDDGRVLAHSPDGLLVLSADGGYVPLSAGVLSRGIQIPRDEASDYHVQVRRDGARKVCKVYLTRWETGSSTHVTYNERLGGFRGGAGFFYPETLPDALGPTASCEYLGRILLGTRDGRIIEQTEAAADDVGTAIDAVLGGMSLSPGGITMETVVESLAAVLATDSGDVRITAYGGRTVQEAFDASKRHLLFAVTARAQEPGLRLDRKASAPAIAFEIAAATTGAAFKVEAVEHQSHARRGLSRHRRIAAPAPAAPCRSPLGDLAFPESDEGGFDEPPSGSRSSRQRPQMTPAISGGWEYRRSRRVARTLDVLRSIAYF